MDEHQGIHLTEEEKYRVTLQVDHFIEIVSKRYSIDPNEVVEAVRWVRERKQFTDKMRSGTMLSLVGVIVGAILLSLWEGIKHLVTQRN
jgi:hypothetical protein